MTTLPSRLKWVRVGHDQQTADGRFVIGGWVCTTGGSVYVKLFDAVTGSAYPCRTVESAKARAREILRAGD